MCYYGSWIPSEPGWHHVAICKEGSNIRLVGDGVSKYLRGIPTNGFPDLPSTQVYIGATSPTYTPNDHYIEEVRFSTTQRFTSFPFTPPDRAYDSNTHKVSGTTNDAARILTFDENTWELVGNETVTTGEYESWTTSGTQFVIGRRDTDGEVIAYGNVEGKTN